MPPCPRASPTPGPWRERTRSRSLPVPSAIRRLRATHLLHRRDDPRIRAAAADVAAHRLAHVVIGRTPGLVQHRDRRHDLTRRAVPALEAVVGDECLLHRVELLAARKPLDRRYAPALLHNGECQARQLTAAVDVHGARAALSVVAALLAAGEPSVFAKGVEQGDARLEGE